VIPSESLRVRTVVLVNVADDKVHRPLLDRVIIAHVFAHAAAVAFEVVDLLVNRIVWGKLERILGTQCKDLCL